jgi:predicted naringenin-chalcone synthase
MSRADDDPALTNLVSHPLFGCGNAAAVTHGAYARLQLSEPAAKTAEEVQRS